MAIGYGVVTNVRELLTSGGNDGNGWSAWQHRGLPEGPIVEAEHNWALSIVLVLVDSLRPCWFHLEPAFYSQLLNKG